MICDFSSRSGLGINIPSIITGGGQAAAAIVPASLVATGTLAATSLAVPVIGVAIAAVTLAVSLFLNRNAQYFGEEKATTAIVNEAETLLKKNLAAWQGLSSTDKTILNQQQALANFDGVWNQVVQACSNTAYSTGADKTGLSPGARCVADRAGSSHGGNGKYDWYSYYRDPIANDQIYVPPVATVLSNIPTDIGSSVSAIFGGGSGGSSSSLIPLILLGLGAWALSELT